MRDYYAQSIVELHMESPSDLIRFEEALDVLGERERRKLLVALMDHNPQPDLPSLAGTDERDISELEGLEAMHHVHLPKLVDFGLIEWDRENHEVSKGPNFVEIRPMLELLDNNSEELPPGWL